MQMIVKGTVLGTCNYAVLGEIGGEIGDRPCFSLQTETGNVHE